MKFILAERTSVKGEHTFNLKYEISQEEIDNFFDSQKPVSEYKYIKNLSKITMRNGIELASFLNNIYSGKILIPSMGAETIYLEGNRLVANYCSFIGMFIDQSEKVLSERNKENLHKFQKITNDLYDTRLEYRFFVMLRHFIMHYSLPFTVLQENLEGNALEFSKSDLLTFSGWKHVKDDIDKMSEKIDIRSLIHPMNASIDVLRSSFLYFISKEIVDAYKAASDFVQKHKTRNPLIAKYNSIEELKSGKLTFTPIDFSLLISAFEDVKKHPKISLEIKTIPLNSN